MRLSNPGAYLRSGGLGKRGPLFGLLNLGIGTFRSPRSYGADLLHTMRRRLGCLQATLPRLNCAGAQSEFPCPTFPSQLFRLHLSLFRTSPCATTYVPLLPPSSHVAIMNFHPLDHRRALPHPVLPLRGNGDADCGLPEKRLSVQLSTCAPSR
jgi:hypothetical protein